MTSTKTRIYDLTRLVTSNESDEKIRKQKQSELTKHIITICENLGYSAKSASSSIDETLLPKIVTVLKEEGLNINLEGLTQERKGKALEKKSKSAKAKLEELPPEPAPPPKKQIIIVRRIKPAPPPEAIPQETLGQPTLVTPQVIKQELVPPILEPKKEEIKPFIPKEVKKREVKTPPGIPLQPFRVAKPTMSPSMMGRTKRPLRKTLHQPQKEKEKKEAELVVTESRSLSVVLTEPLTVKGLAERLTLPETEVVKSLFTKGIMKTVNQMLELDVAIDCAKSLGYEVIIEEATKEEISLQPDISLEQEEDLVPRPPVVTIMGHVDHGKTSLLDAIRETKFKLTEQETGGITQHIGAYQVEVVDYDGNKRRVTFLDTPGHEAFTAMRARGAQVTDIAILVVAADDGVMPQTIEAINHAKAAGVPIVVAVNKIDKEGAQPDRVIGQLVEHDLLPEEYGGKTVCSRISAKKKLNLEDLLTKITLVADAELTSKLRANPKQFASGAVIEAELSKERGPIAHMLIQNGTLKKGDCLVAGSTAGRVRAMFDDHGREVSEAPPAMPVEVIGLSDVPRAGDVFQVHKTYQQAKEIAEQRKQKEQEKKQRIGLADFSSKVREGQAHELKVIIKADVQGSAEAVSKEVVKLSTKEVIVRPIHVGSGNISESDTNLAASADAIIIGFHVTIDPNAQKIASEDAIDVRLYEIIYKITEDLEKAILGLLEPEKHEVKLGVSEIRQIFTVGKGKKIAGCYVLEGKIQRNQIGRVTRNGQMTFEGKIDSLKRFKDDAREVQAGFECGITFDNFQDLEMGDQIECWTIIEKERTSLS